MDLNGVTGRIIGAAIAVHRALGPGLLESTYQACLLAELRRKGLRVREQVAVPIVYEGVRLECGYRMDLLVEERVAVELKAVAKVDRIFLAQLLTYLKHSTIRHARTGPHPLTHPPTSPILPNHDERDQREPAPPSSSRPDGLRGWRAFMM